MSLGVGSPNYNATKIAELDQQLTYLNSKRAPLFQLIRERLSDLIVHQTTENELLEALCSLEELEVQTLKIDENQRNRQRYMGYEVDSVKREYDERVRKLEEELSVTQRQLEIANNWRNDYYRDKYRPYNYYRNYDHYYEHEPNLELSEKMKRFSDILSDLGKESITNKKPLITIDRQMDFVPIREGLVISGPSAVERLTTNSDFSRMLAKYRPDLAKEKAPKTQTMVPTMISITDSRESLFKAIAEISLQMAKNIGNPIVIDNQIVGSQSNDYTSPTQIVIPPKPRKSINFPEESYPRNVMEKRRKY